MSVCILGIFWLEVAVAAVAAAAVVYAKILDRQLKSVHTVIDFVVTTCYCNCWHYCNLQLLQLLL